MRAAQFKEADFSPKEAAVPVLRSNKKEQQQWKKLENIEFWLVFFFQISDAQRINENSVCC